MQMLANTAIYGVMVALFVAAFRSILPATSWIAFALFAILNFSLPWTWGTTLEGFNSQWHFLLLFSVAGIIAIVDAKAFSLQWWFAVLLLLSSYFFMAAGATTTAAAFSTCAVQLAVGSRRGLGQLIALAFIAAMTVAMGLSIPMLPDHAPMRAHSLGQFLQAFIEFMSWPAATGLTFIFVLIIIAILTHAPAWLTSIDVIRTRLDIADRRWRFVALAIWETLQAAAVAYGRAEASITALSRSVYDRAARQRGASFVSPEHLSRFPAAARIIHRGRRCVAAAGSRRHDIDRRQTFDTRSCGKTRTRQSRNRKLARLS